MRLLRVHTAIGDQSEKMQAAVTGPSVLHGVKQHGMLKELAVLDHQVDTSDVHVNDAACTDIQMADFAIAHLSLGEADEGPAGVDQRIGILAQQPVVRRLARERNSVGFGFSAVSPAVEDDQNERFRTRQCHSWSISLMRLNLKLSLRDWRERLRTLF